jgi:hypothetical protein
MIELVDARLVDWVRSVLGSVSVTLEPPRANRAERGVSLYLLALDRLPPPRGTERPPLQLALVYLVTPWAEDVEQAHHLLGELVLAALDSAELTVELEPLSEATWSAFGVPPQPSFLLRMPLRRERPQPDLSVVREPLVIRASPITSLSGVLLGPGDVPLSGAQVEMPHLRRTVRSDVRGRFHFETIPAESLGSTLSIKVKGREFRVDLQRLRSDGEPVVICLDLLN